VFENIVVSVKTTPASSEKYYILKGVPVFINPENVATLVVIDDLIDSSILEK
jgi:hypothetical protein